MRNLDIYTNFSEFTTHNSYLIIQITLFPNGVNARAAILKCCLPNGIPIIVMHSIIPKSRCVTQVQNPPSRSHNMFIKTDRHPLEPPLSITLLPNGHSANTANLSVCRPNGKPIIVIIIRILVMRYSIAVIRPPKMSQIILPKNFI